MTTIAVDTLIFVGAAAAWNIFSGYSGYISLGNAVFFGCGAYTVGIAARDWQVTGTAVFALLPLAAVVATVVAVPFGLIALRVRRHTFVVVTIAVFFIFQLMAFNFSFTGGTTGVSAPFLLWNPATYNNPFYYLALAIAVATVALSWLIRGSRFGLQLRAIRDDEDRARGLGVRTMHVKLAAFMISAFVTGLLGGLWFYFITQVLPQSGFDPAFDLVRRADGLPRRPGHRVGSGARRPDPRTGAAVPHRAVHERLSQPDRSRRAVPGRHPPAATGRDPHGEREDHLMAGQTLRPPGRARHAAAASGQATAPPGEPSAAAGTVGEGESRDDRAVAGRAGIQGVRRRAGAQRLHS